MPQVSVYMKNDIYDKCINWIREQGASVSRFVRKERLSQRLSLYLDKDVYEKVRYRAKIQGVSMSCFIREFLVEKADNYLASLKDSQE